MWRLGSPKHQNYHGFLGLPTAESQPPADLGRAPAKRLTDSGQGMSVGHLLRAAGVTLRISIPTLFDALLGRLTAEVCDARLDWWSKRLLGQARVSLQTVGVEHARGAKAFVVMSNHQSLYDIPALFQALPLRLRMVAKTELFRIPIWAQAMRVAGFVELDRSARERAIESLERAKAALAQGTSIWIAPEGTRSREGSLAPFKLGGFHLAAGAGAPILPVTVAGTRMILPAKGARVALGAIVRVTVHPAIDPAEYGNEVNDSLVHAVRTSIESALTD
jgi:1-acyl-sn-glycerol-3-phosphate acyltransferase